MYQSHADFVLADLLSATHSILIMREFKLAAVATEFNINFKFHASSLMMCSSGHDIRTTHAFLLLILLYIGLGFFVWFVNLTCLRKLNSNVIIIIIIMH